MKRAFLPLLAVLALAGCGSSQTTHHVRHATASAPSPQITAPAQCNPAPGQGHLGVCVTQPAASSLRVGPGATLGTSLRYLPDVYEGTGGINWGAAHSRGLYAAIVKAFEVNYRQDGQFANSWHQLAALHLWHAAYLFVRAGNCTAIADTYVNIVKSAGGWDQFAGPPILDVEVPGANGNNLVPCLISRIQHDTGISTVIVYTAPGTWPGGPSNNAPLWIATYGSSFGCIWTCHPVAWQFTDGRFGPSPHAVYGLPAGDVSVDYGISSMLAHPAPPPDPYAIYPKTVFQFLNGKVHASEYYTVKGWDNARCLNPVKRTVCKATHYHLQLLQDRIWFVAHHTADLKRTVAKARWGVNDLGARFAGISHRLAQK